MGSNVILYFGVLLIAYKMALLPQSIKLAGEQGKIKLQLSLYRL